MVVSLLDNAELANYLGERLALRQSHLRLTQLQDDLLDRGLLPAKSRSHHAMTNAEKAGELEMPLWIVVLTRFAFPDQIHYDRASQGPY